MSEGAARANDLPGGTSMASLEIYRSARRALVDEERRLFWDYDAKCSATEDEREANAILLKLKESERANLFGDLPGESLPGPDSRDMGGRFLVNKDRIERSNIYKIAEYMPKGCHLHVHFNSELPAVSLISNVRKFEDTVFITSDRRLDAQAAYDEAEIMFRTLPENHPQVDLFQCHPIGSNDSGRAWMKWKSFRDSFSGNFSATDSMSGLDAAENWAISKIIFNEDLVYGKRQTLNGVWAHYNQCTRAIKGLTSCESLFREYVEESIHRMTSDRIYYAEWRRTFIGSPIFTDDGLRSLSHAEQMDVIAAVIAKQKESSENEAFIGIKIIYCAPRSISLDQMETELANCVELKQKHGDMICGFDLVGAEDRVNNIGYYAELLLSFQHTCKNLELDIPFVFHAGETMVDKGGTDKAEHSNLYDALLLNTRRVGHGVSLTRHPLLVKEYKRRNIALEICPISNELLHLCTNAKEHRLPDLLAAGLVCTINADNPLIFRSTLSHNFYQVLVGSPSMSLSGCRQLVQWSIDHSCMSDREKELARKRLAVDWEKFLRWIIASFGGS